MNNRRFTEAEARAALAMFWTATRYARRLAAVWEVRRPHKDEFFNLAMRLRRAEEIAERTGRGSETGGTQFDSVTRDLEELFQQTLKDLEA